MEPSEFIFRFFVASFAVYGVIQIFGSRSRADKESAVIWVLQHAKEGLLLKELHEITGISTWACLSILNKYQDEGLAYSTRDKEWPNRFRYHVNVEALQRLKKMADAITGSDDAKDDDTRS